MEIDEDKIDDAVLALLWLTLHNERCAWKGFDWATTDRLHKKSALNKSQAIEFANRWDRCEVSDFASLIAVAAMAARI